MRAKYLWPCVAMAVLAAIGPAAGQSGMRWAPNLEIAKRAASQTNRLVLVHFWSKTCGPCMKMEQEVFPRADVAAAVDVNFVPVQINAQEHPQIAREFGVKALPTDVIITPQGGVVERRVGGLDAIQYVGALNQIAGRARSASPQPQQGYAQANQTQAQTQARVPGATASGLAASDAAGRAWPPSAAGQQPASRYPQQPASILPAANAVAARTPSGIAQGQAQGYGSSYQAQAGGAPPQSSVPTAQPQAQPWQAETARWNAGTSGSNVNSAPTPSAAQRPAAAVAPSPATQPWSRPPATSDAVARSQPTPNAPTPPATAERPANPPLALDGYCPVVLAEKEQWVKGDPQYGVIHRDRTYLFTGPDEAKRFFADPDRFAPVLWGMDVVVSVEENRRVPGKREHGAWYEGRVYLFSTDTSLGKFAMDPGRYASAVKEGSSAGAGRPPARPEPPPMGRNPGQSPYGSPARY